jgi:hypothetical protein
VLKFRVPALSYSSSYFPLPSLPYRPTYPTLPYTASSSCSPPITASSSCSPPITASSSCSPPSLPLRPVLLQSLPLSIALSCSSHHCLFVLFSSPFLDLPTYLPCPILSLFRVLLFCSRFLVLTIFFCLVSYPPSLLSSPLLTISLLSFYILFVLTLPRPHHPILLLSSFLSDPHLLSSLSSRTLYSLRFPLLPSLSYSFFLPSFSPLFYPPPDVTRHLMKVPSSS